MGCASEGSTSDRGRESGLDEGHRGKGREGEMNSEGILSDRGKGSDMTTLSRLAWATGGGWSHFLKHRTLVKGQGWVWGRFRVQLLDPLSLGSACMHELTAQKGPGRSLPYTSR